MAGLGVLGAIAVADAGGVAVPVRSVRQRLLLAVLVSRLGRVVSADELIEAMWAAELPTHPLAALQSQVFRLRRQIAAAGASVENDGAGYRLTCARRLVDAARFDDLMTQAGSRAADRDVTLGHLDEALALWRGRAYLEVAEHEAVRVEAQRLEERRAAAIEQRADLLIELGRAGEAVTAMEELAQEHPYRERPVAMRMRALATSGRHAEALRTYRAFTTRLGDDLGLEPSPELRALESEILRHELPSRPRLGLPGNSLVGREVDLAAVTARQQEARLVTLTGPGGVGKTRLALHAAARAEPRYVDGVYLCELASVDVPDDVVPAVASTLRVQRDAEHTELERIVQFLGPRTALLVLDNCEHVLDGARKLVACLLARTPDVDVLATSRTRLGVDGEQLLPIGPLPVPGHDEPSGPAVELFVDRARALQPSFALDEDNAGAVEALCRRLDGLPLAIELAAARTLVRTPAEILGDLTARGDQLEDPRRTEGRHRSMDAVLDWSYRRLSPAEQHVFSRVAVFSDGFTVDAAEAVAETSAGEIVAVVRSLVDHSLITGREVGGAMRFFMLEPVRQYAGEQLRAAGDAGTAEARHASWMATWMEVADAGLRTADEARWVAAIEAELANLRTAFRWSLGHDPETAARIAGSLYWYAYWYGAAEAFEWAATITERHDEVSPPTLARACATAALGAGRHGDLARARQLARQVLEARGPLPAESTRFLWEALSSIELMAGSYELALAHQQQALDLARLSGDVTHQARELATRALVLGYLGRPDDAQAELAAARTVLASTANPTIEGFCSYVAGEIRLDDDPAGAVPRLEDARDVGRSTGSQFLAAIAGLSALTGAARCGDRDDVLAGSIELLDYFQRAGSRAQQWTVVRALIDALTQLGRDEPAIVLLGALGASSSALPVIGSDAIRLRAAETQLRARVGAERFERVAAEGAALGDDAAIGYASRCATGGS